MADAKRKGRNPAQVAKRAKLVVLPLTLMPLAIALVRYFTDQFGVDAIGDFTLDTGNWGIRLLLATLAVTPIRELTGWNWLITYRRPLGLASFYYLCVHLLVYAYLDFALNLEFILIDVTESIFIVVGVAGFLLLIPLAITSTTGWIRRLGKRWRMLHRLAYLALILGVVHYLLQVKEITFQLAAYMVAGALLLGYRIVAPLLKRAGAGKSSARSRQAATTPRPAGR